MFAGYLPTVYGQGLKGKVAIDTICVGLPVFDDLMRQANQAIALREHVKVLSKLDSINTKELERKEASYIRRNKETAQLHTQNDSLSTVIANRGAIIETQESSINKQQEIINKLKKGTRQKPWGLGLGTGYGLNSTPQIKSGVFIGFVVSYRLISW